MTPAQRRAARRAATAAVAAAAAWGATGLPGKALLRGPLALLAVTALGNLAVQARTAAKAYSVEARLNSHIAATAAAVNLVANGGAVGGPLTAIGTTGVGGQGSVMGDADGDADMGDISGTVTTGNINTMIHQINDVKHAHNALVTDVQACVNRVNDLLAAFG